MRDLTAFGKISIIKAHLQSQLVYQLSVLPTPPKALFGKIEKLLFKYMWSNKPDKIKQKVMYSSREDGGVTMLNIVIQDKSLKIGWVNRLHNHPQSTWAQLAFRFLPPGGIAISQGNISYKDILTSNLRSTNRFWKDVLLAWAKLS